MYMAKRDFVDHSDSVDPVGESETEVIDNFFTHLQQSSVILILCMFHFV